MIVVSETQVREAAWNRLGRAYNPGTAFQKYAGAQNVGFPMMGEFDFGGYRVQGYAQGIVYCRIGDWANARSIPWSEEAESSKQPVGAHPARAVIAESTG